MKEFYFIKSPNPIKKYRAIFVDDGSYVDFGQIRKNRIPFTQYKDQALGIYSEYDTLDKKKRQNYYKRHPIDYPKYSADYMSKVFLWN